MLRHNIIGFNLNLLAIYISPIIGIYGKVEMNILISIITLSCVRIKVRPANFSFSDGDSLHALDDSFHS